MDGLLLLSAPSFHEEDFGPKALGPYREHGLHAVAITADAATMAFQKADGSGRYTIEVWNVEANSKRFESEPTAQWMGEVGFVDGLLCIAHAASLRLLDPRTGQTVWDRPLEPRLRGLSVSPGADRLALITESRLLVVGVEDGAVVSEFGWNDVITPMRIEFADDGQRLVVLGRDEVTMFAADFRQGWTEPHGGTSLATHPELPHAFFTTWTYGSGTRRFTSVRHVDLKSGESRAVLREDTDDMLLEVQVSPDGSWFCVHGPVHGDTEPKGEHVTICSTQGALSTS